MSTQKKLNNEVIPYIRKSSSNIGYTKKYIDLLIEKFKTSTLPAEMRTHHAHFIITLYYCFVYIDYKDCQTLVMNTIREKIIAHNMTFDAPGKEKRYNETITGFRVRIILHFTMTVKYDDIYELIHRFLSSQMTDKNFILKYYSVFPNSDEAKRSYIAPDLQMIIC